MTVARVDEWAFDWFVGQVVQTWDPSTCMHKYPWVKSLNEDGWFMGASGATGCESGVHITYNAFPEQICNS